MINIEKYHFFYNHKDGKYYVDKSYPQKKSKNKKDKISRLVSPNTLTPPIPPSTVSPHGSSSSLTRPPIVPPPSV